MSKQIDLKVQQQTSNEYPPVTVSNEYLSTARQGDPLLHNIKCTKNFDNQTYRGMRWNRH